MAAFDRAAADTKGRDIEVLMETSTKHWVRKEVWLPMARARCERVHRPIRYFTLTTQRLIDVKTLAAAGLLERTPRGFPGLGFCELLEREYAAIRRSLGWCPLSYNGTFEQMVVDYQYFDEMFDFDVINLDFISVPFPAAEAPFDGTWNALKKIIEVQGQHARSFDLFLTFRCVRNETHAGALDELVRLLASNLEVGRGSDQFEQRVGHAEPGRLLEDNYAELLSLGLPKLVVGKALESGYSMSDFRVYTYPRAGGADPYSITKFTFSFEWRTGARRLGDPPRLVEDYDMAVRQVFGTAAVALEARIAETGLGNTLEDEARELAAAAV